MANTTFTGPVVALNGFIGGPNVNSGGTGTNDTQQGGNVAWTASNVTTLTIATGPKAGETLLATANEGVMLYIKNVSGASVPGYCFSDGTTWKQIGTSTNIVPA